MLRVCGGGSMLNSAAASVDHSHLPTYTLDTLIMHATEQIIQHYATPAGQPGHKCHRPRSLFVNSLGTLIQQSGRRFDAFYGKPPSNPHPNLLGYEAMGDMLAYHIKVYYVYM